MWPKQKPTVYQSLGQGTDNNRNKVISWSDRPRITQQGSNLKYNALKSNMVIWCVKSYNSSHYFHAYRLNIQYVHVQ